MSFQTEKRLVRDYYDALDQADTAVGDVLKSYCAGDYIWRGYHPFGMMTSVDEVAERFWQPFKESMRRIQRRPDIFFAGQNSLRDDGGVWVVSMGHLLFLFDKPWLGIRPSRKLSMLRYCEFSFVKNGKIHETAFYFDIPHLMAQAGLNPFPHQTAAQLIQPGPLTHDGLQFDDADPAAGKKTQALINAMCDDLGTWNLGLPLEEELARTWQDDMIWWGPTGIGATYTIERYAKQHSGPFRAAFTDRSFSGHLCRVSEGHYGGFFGWPNFTARHTGGFMGLPSSEQSLSFNVIDIYRRDGDKLAENWIFIDLLYMLAQQGDDVLARMASIYPAEPV